MPSLGARPPPNAQTIASTKYDSNAAWSALAFRFSGRNMPSRMFTSVVQKFIVSSGVMCWNDFFISKMVLGTYLSTSSRMYFEGNSGFFHLAFTAYSGTTRLIQDWIMLYHWSFSETYTMPARVAVAGVANFKLRISKMSFMCGNRRMRSFEGSVSSRLSSIVEFMDSIQFASRSPSRMIHFGSSSGMVASSRM